jgi:carbonic anhydrase
MSAEPRRNLVERMSAKRGPYLIERDGTSHMLVDLHRKIPLQCACVACSGPSRGKVARRRFLAGSVTALVAGMSGLPGASAQSALTPDAALDQLMAGNARYAAGRLTSFDDDLTILRENTVAKQEPFAAVLSCADSRVPVELLFDQSIGHVFVGRVAGNICSPEMFGSLEYGAAVLNIPLLVVLGHDGCGAVKAAIAGQAVPGQISALFAPIRPAVERAGPDLEATIKANAQIQADLLRTASPVIAGLAKQGKLKVVAAYYDLATGLVSLLG